MSDSVQPTRLARPWDSPGKNTGVSCHFLLQYMKMKSESEVAQSFPTLRDPMDCSLPGSSIHGIFQARVLEWGAIAFSKILYSTTTTAKSLQSCPTLCDSIDVSPPGSPVPGVLQARTHREYSNYFLITLFFNFNWRLITLQYCSSFCHTLT